MLRRSERGEKNLIAEMFKTYFVHFGVDFASAYVLLLLNPLLFAQNTKVGIQNKTVYTKAHTKKSGSLYRLHSFLQIFYSFSIDSFSLRRPLVFYRANTIRWNY